MIDTVALKEKVLELAFSGKLGKSCDTKNTGRNLYEEIQKEKLCAGAQGHDLLRRRYAVHGVSVQEQIRGEAEAGKLDPPDGKGRLRVCTDGQRHGAGISGHPDRECGEAGGGSRELQLSV